MDEDSNAEQKTGQVYSSGKRNVFRLHLNEFSPGRRERSFHEEGLKTEKEREPTVERLV